MGTYLPKPVTTKIPQDEANDTLEYGASSMQGWRLSQEDEHNCLLDYDKDTSLFAVYDGHGGAEVAKYTAQHFPEYLKNIQEYKDGNIKDALIESFLGFDAILKEDDVKENLKELAELNFDEGDAEDEEQETAMLFEEADMPLDQLLLRYGSSEGGKPKAVHRVANKEKTLSPMIRAKKTVSIFDKEAAGGEGDVKPDSKDQLMNGHSKPESVVDSTGDNEAKAASVPTSLKEENSEPVTSDAQISSGKDTISVKSDSKASDSQQSGSSSSQSGSAVEAVTCSSSSDGGGTVSTSGTSEAADEDAVGGSSVVTSSGVSEGSSSTAPEADGGCSASSAQGSEPCSSSGRTNKKRRGVIPEEGEDESSFDEDEETTDEEEDSDEEGLDGEKYWSSDSEDSEEDDEDDIDDQGPFGTPGEDNGEPTERITAGEEPGFDSGCTAVVALLRGKELYVANAGDSRCVLCRAGRAVDLSVDHKPGDPPEESRITKAGGRITADGRVNGGLNLSRAIGDHRYKQNENVPFREQMITSLPDIMTTTICEEDEFLVLACDGIWNVMSSQDVVHFVRERIMAGMYPLSDICGEMFELCLAPDTKNDGTGCDNMTCIIVNLNPKKRSSEADAKESAPKTASLLRTENTSEVEAAVDSTASDDSLNGKRKAEPETESDSTSVNKKHKSDSDHVDSTDSTG